MSGLRPELYPHGASAFAAAQQLAGAAFGAVFISTYPIGSGARDAGVLDLTQAVSAANAAFLTALAIGAVVLLASFVGRAPSSGNRRASHQQDARRRNGPSGGRSVI